MKTFQDFLQIMDFIGNQMVQGPNDTFGTASKGFKRHQTMNKGLYVSIIWRKSWNVFIKNLNFFSLEERKTWTS